MFNYFISEKPGEKNEQRIIPKINTNAFLIPSHLKNYSNLVNKLHKPDL
jgi:hypothetical protein